jgi:hypothetical protein
MPFVYVDDSLYLALQSSYSKEMDCLWAFRAASSLVCRARAISPATFNLQHTSRPAQLVTLYSERPMHTVETHLRLVKKKKNPIWS